MSVGGDEEIKMNVYEDVWRKGENEISTCLA